ncbi:hypothetical protein DNTS_027272 [Danionella cerebrum]|uniref:Uncharacterized protein n=1 Tax=Danionella cerebrum TaxID=2873325 RepID=A0A553R4G4_9TELE|nr:hypothetical protein DNTS_027272 [Danionella translucida]
MKQVGISRTCSSVVTSSAARVCVHSRPRRASSPAQNVRWTPELAAKELMD